MKIDYIKINGFGKIKNKEIELKDGINIIYGGNEIGKTTVLKFIRAMLYGISKNKNGKTRSDFEQYKPWDDSEFSGKIRYTLDQSKEYEVFRDFKKKNPIVYQANEDISKQFDVDKTKVIHFFEEQTGMDEASFCNTAIIGQQEVKLEKADTNIMVQKISNLISSGNDQISFKKSMQQLVKLQNENIGTDRTKQKPMNVVDESIKKLLDEKNKLNEYKKNMVSQNIQKEQIKMEIEKLEEQKREFKIAKDDCQKDKIKSLENKFKRNICIYLFVFFIVIAILSFVFLKHKVIAFIPTGIAMIVFFMGIKMNRKSKGGNLNLDAHKIEKEIENIETKINDLRVKSHILETEKTNMDEKLEELARIEEKLEEQKIRKEELLSLNISYEIAKECLERAYDEVKHNLSPQFEQKLCEISSYITNGKYSNVKVNDENGLCIEVENGAYMPVDRLSIGTIDEMYLSLRLSTLSEISKENLPILLDETFAYFDNRRLQNILAYLQDQYYNNQILIFTCTNREMEVLESLKIEYHLIDLEN